MKRFLFLFKRNKPALSKKLRFIVFDGYFSFRVLPKKQFSAKQTNRLKKTPLHYVKKVKILLRNGKLHNKAFWQKGLLL
jgi:hypothetical protein